MKSTIEKDLSGFVLSDGAKLVHKAEFYLCKMTEKKLTPKGSEQERARKSEKEFWRKRKRASKMENQF